MSHEAKLSLPFVVICIVLMLFLMILTTIDPYIGKRQRRTLMIISWMVISLILQNYLEWKISVSTPEASMILLRKAVSVYGYSIRPAILIMFCKLVNPNRKYRIGWSLIVMNSLLYCSVFFSSIVYTITDNNHYLQGPLANVCLYLSAGLLGFLIYLTVREYKPENHREFWILILVVVFILGCVLFDYHVGNEEQVVSFLTVSVAGSSIFYYIWLHLKFVREHEQDLKAQQRIQIMLSQIQPHFLYNTLSTIQALCYMNPEKAAHTTEQFGLYLRQNIDSLNNDVLIPIEKELEHTRVYADIEMTRFSNIHLEQEIDDKDYMVPPLTIQPMVENAIRHGVRIREQGIVRIITKRTDAYHEIIISDNGKGFDTEAPELADETHVGIHNVRERIEQMCGGTLSIESHIGEGTTVTIRIPII